MTDYFVFKVGASRAGYFTNGKDPEEREKWMMLEKEAVIAGAKSPQRAVFRADYLLVQLR